MARIVTDTPGFLMTLIEGPTPSNGTTIMPPQVQRRNAPENPWAAGRWEKDVDMSGRP
jgi:hypothetical protein